jgi:hypothetical protein
MQKMPDNTNVLCRHRIRIVQIATLSVAIQKRETRSIQIPRRTTLLIDGET